MFIIRLIHVKIHVMIRLIHIKIHVIIHMIREDTFNDISDDTCYIVHVKIHDDTYNEVVLEYKNFIIEHSMY